MARKRKNTESREESGASRNVIGEARVETDPSWVERIRTRLLAWYEREHRDLPWRASPDPYRILVSEMMLVQTTVAAVVPYYTRFLARFPDVRALAASDETEVLKVWEGLGYYRRARQLHAAAQAIVTRHRGTFPENEDDIRALPGVGRYIAGAILSFAFDHPAPILEANTERVLARWLACREDVKAKATQERLWQASARLVPPTGAGKFNQAFMELGALICAPRAPLCLVCPVASECAARAHGLQEQLPLRAPKPPPLAVSEACALVYQGRQWLIVQRGPGGMWDGFWEFPTIHRAGADPGGRSFGIPLDLASGVLRLTGAAVRIGPEATTIRYTVTRHQVVLEAYWAEALSASLSPGPGLVKAVWELPENLVNYPFGSAHRRLASWVVRHAPRVGREADEDAGGSSS